MAFIYDIRAEANSASSASWKYFTELSVRCPGLVVELGVGTGKVAIAAARRGKSSIGLDTSFEMLSLCSRNAAAAGVTPLVHLVLGDASEVSFNRQVDLVTFPFRGIGHIATPAHMSTMFRNILKMLTPGGRFIFDHYIINHTWASEVAGKPQKICEFSASDGRSLRIEDTYYFDYATQLITCKVAVMERNIRINEALLIYSWTYPDQFEKLIKEVGFNIDGVYADYEGGLMSPTAEQQIWILRKP